MLSRSRMASAEWPSRAASTIRSSGSDAPSRKLNADRACSSTYSVIAALHEPTAAGFAINAIKSTIAEGDIPLVAIPGFARPPAAGSAPGPGGRDDFSGKPGCPELHRPMIQRFHLRGQCGAIKTKREARFRHGSDPWRGKKWLRNGRQTEWLGTMRIQ